MSPGGKEGQQLLGLHWALSCQQVEEGILHFCSALLSHIWSLWASAGLPHT